MSLDILIKGGLIVDGTGRAAYRGDVAVAGGKIVDVGKVSETAARVVDADGLAVAPGFWDMHTHYDAQLLWDPLATSSSWHGITTVITGNCGFTLAPCRPEDQEWMMRTLARVEGMNPEVLGGTMPWPWEGFGEYLDRLDESLGVNAAPLVGYTALRRYVMGEEGSERATCTPEELAEMRRVLAESLDAGGIGLSTSRSAAHWDADLLPVPSRVADLEEYMSLLPELQGRRAGYLQMSQGSKEFRPTSEEGLSLLVEMVRLSGRPVCWNTIGPQDWRRHVDRLQQFREEGIPFFGLSRPNNLAMDFRFKFTNVFDRWATWQSVFFQPPEKIAARMREPGLRQVLREELKTDTLGLGGGF